MNFLFVFVEMHLMIIYWDLGETVNCVLWPSTRVVMRESGRCSLCWERRDWERLERSREWLLGGLFMGGRLMEGKLIA